MDDEFEIMGQETPNVTTLMSTGKQIPKEKLDQEDIRRIIAFYNVFAKELSLEDFVDLKELVWFLPIMANLIETGNLVFVSKPNFGFCQAVDFLRQQGTLASITESLHSSSAEAGDTTEALKIYIAFIYQFRVLHPEKFTDCCNRLSISAQSLLASIIATMDNDVNALANSTQITNAFHSPARSGCSSGLSKIIPLTTTQTLKRSQIVSRGSPISLVLGSPRGEEVAKYGKIAKENIDLKHRLNDLGSQYDLLNNKNEQLQQMVEDMSKIIENLQDGSKNPAINYFKNRIMELEGSLMQEQSTITTLQAQLVDLQQKFDISGEERRRIIFEKETAYRQLDNLTTEHNKLVQNYENIRAIANERSFECDGIRKTFLESDSALKHEIMVRDDKIRSLELQLNLQASKFQKLLFEKESEITHFKLMGGFSDGTSLNSEFQQIDNNKFQAIQSELLSVEEQLNKTLTSKIELEHDRQILQSRVSELIDDKAAIVSKEHDVHNENKSLQDKLRVLENDNNSLRSNLGTLASRKSDLQKSIEERDQKIQNLEALLEEKNVKICELTKKLENKSTKTAQTPLHHISLVQPPFSQSMAFSVSINDLEPVHLAEKTCFDD